jgi:hypothetical protein
VDDLNGDEGDGQLLVRDAEGAERNAVVGLFSSIGWTGAARGVCDPSSHSVVLYDPAGDDIYGAATIRPVAEGTFVLLGVAVRGLADPAAAGARLVREVADQARRAGGERLVADMHTTHAAHGLLVSAGFEVVGGAVGESGGSMMYLEL